MPVARTRLKGEGKDEQVEMGCWRGRGEVGEAFGFGPSHLRDRRPSPVTWGSKISHKRAGIGKLTSSAVQMN